MILPTLDQEKACWQAGARRVAGVDEAGVGPLCAAVVAAAVVLPVEIDPRRLEGVRDSKTVADPATREELAAMIRAVAEQVAIAAASPREIERLNVRGATALAMRRALARLHGYDHALVDGRPLRGFDTRIHTFVVDGDALCFSIAAASIMAKVARDRLLGRLAARYPGYGWERNAGYATAEHLDALRQLGPTPHHRRHYRPVLQQRLDLASGPEAWPGDGGEGAAVKG